MIISEVKDVNEPGEATIGRRARKKERTRREIYRTAMHLFAERDYERVTIEDICAGAGVAKATFFLHFENKAALLQEFNDEITQMMAERLAGHSGDAEAQLLFLMAAFKEAGENNAPVMRKMLREFLDQPALITKATAVNQSLLDLVTQIVKRGQEKGELRDSFMPQVAAVAIVSPWSAITALWMEQPQTDTDALNRQFLDIALNGLKKRA
jgi:AcrR family transcriptional regulator